MTIDHLFAQLEQAKKAGPDATGAFFRQLKTGPGSPELIEFYTQTLETLKQSDGPLVAHSCINDLVDRRATSVVERLELASNRLPAMAGLVDYRRSVRTAIDSLREERASPTDCNCQIAARNRWGYADYSSEEGDVIRCNKCGRRWNLEVNDYGHQPEYTWSEA